MRLRFWGTRGSVPTPGAGTVRHGGNTSCVEVRADDGSLVILDCGTGARPLGNYLAAQKESGPIWLLLTHYHWDHIQGFPFFLPAFLPGTELHVVGPAGLQRGLEETLAGQMQYNYFPVSLTELTSRLSFHEIGEGAFSAASFSVESHSLNHTCPALGYRLSVGGASLVYATDHEPFWPHDADSAALDFTHAGDRRHIEFLRGADLVIHDAQYTAGEYASRRGWGHSTVEYVIDLALAAEAHRLALFHHDPSHDDAFVDTALVAGRKRVRRSGRELELFASSEGQEVRLEEPFSDSEPPQWAPYSLSPPCEVVLLVGKPNQRQRIRDLVSPEGVRMIDVPNAALGLPPSSGRRELVIASVEAGAHRASWLDRLSKSLSGRPLVAVLPEEASHEDFLRVSDIATDVIAEPLGRPMFRSRLRTALYRG